MEITKAKRTAVIARNTRGDWTVQQGRYEAVLPATGPEVDAWVDGGEPLEVEEAPERVAKLATKVVTRERHKPTEPSRKDHFRHLVQLDGQESTYFRVTDRAMFSTKREPTEWTVFCDSQRCREAWRAGRPDDLEPTEIPILVVHRRDHQEAGITRQVTDAAEQAAYDARNDHIEWHRSTFGIHPRVELDRWLDRTTRYHAEIGVSEFLKVDREEIDYQLSIAKAEQASERERSR